MLLRAKTDGTISGTGTVSMASPILGGVLITADGTNNATVIIRKNSSTGERIFHVVTKQPLWVGAPMEAAGTIYYDISGTGATAQIYEYVP